MTAPLARPAAVLFDIGGTLLRERGYDLRAAVDDLLGDPALATRCDAAEARAVTRELALRIEHVHQTNEAEFVFADWLREQLAAEATPRRLQELEERLWKKSARLVPMPGARDALVELRGAGVDVAAVSNAIFTAETLRGALERGGLAEPLAFVLSSADVGVRKPEPAIFREALHRIGAAAGRTWFVGDSFDKDVVGSAALGMQAIWMAPREARPEADAPHERIEGFDDLVALFRTSA